MRLWNGYRWIDHVEPNGFSVRDGVPLIYGRKRVSAPLAHGNLGPLWAPGGSFDVGSEPEKES
jgi:hypothetical protein